MLQVLGGRWASLLSELACAERALQRQLHQAPASEQQALQVRPSQTSAAGFCMFLTASNQ
jgi:hypothetical protein